MPAQVLIQKKWERERERKRKIRMATDPFSPLETRPEIPRSVSRRISFRPRQDRRRSGCHPPPSREWRIRKIARRIAHSDEPRFPCGLSSQGSRFGANEIHDSVVTALCRRARREVLSTAQLLNLSTSAQIMFTAPQFGQVY